MPTDFDPAIVYQWGMRYDAFFARARKLIQAHWNESGTFNEVLGFHPHHQIYRNAERMGALHILTAWSDGELVGYMTLFILDHPRDVTVKLVKDDVIYVRPDFRKFKVGWRMLELALERCEPYRAQGPLILNLRDKDHTGAYLERMGFELVERVYGKILPKSLSQPQEKVA